MEDNGRGEASFVAAPPLLSQTHSTNMAWAHRSTLQTHSRWSSMSAETAFIVFISVILLIILVARIRPTAQGGDRAITAAVNEALAKEFRFSNSQIDVKTFDGVVILGGFTHEYDQAKRAVEIARGIQGVTSVENRMSIRSGS